MAGNGPDILGTHVTASIPPLHCHLCITINHDQDVLLIVGSAHETNGQAIKDDSMASADIETRRVIKTKKLRQPEGRVHKKGFPHQQASKGLTSADTHWKP
eukprot:1139595-Pelagomonas_calceolata.AAC.3